MPHIHGIANIKNTSNIKQEFSTKYLMLSANNLQDVRAYKMTIASETIDFSTIKIEPEEEFKIEIYWVPELKIGNKLKDVVLKCIINNKLR